MARHESDREDILREATALVQRAELTVAGCGEPVVVGFRREGAASVFFGADPVYQFNTANELRRAYLDGLLYKAERGKLIELRRERSEREVALVRRELSGPETADLLSKMQQHLNDLRAALAAGQVRLIAQVPENGQVVANINEWLTSLPAEMAVASAANVR
jgi:hypothetical protein